RWGGRLVANRLAVQNTSRTSRRRSMKRSRLTVLAAAAAASLATVAAVVQLGAANPQAKLAEDVRRATAAYHDVALAEKAGYGAFLGCVNGPQQGAMGADYVDGDYLNDDVLDPHKPPAAMPD